MWLPRALLLLVIPRHKLEPEPAPYPVLTTWMQPGALHTTALSSTAPSSRKGVSFPLRPRRVSGCNYREVYSAMSSDNERKEKTGQKRRPHQSRTITTFSADSWRQSEPLNPKFRLLPRQPWVWPKETGSVGLKGWQDTRAGSRTISRTNTATGLEAEVPAHLPFCLPLALGGMFLVHCGLFLW